MRILGMDTPELLFIGLIGVLLFGANKLPELGKSVANTIKEFKKAMRDNPAGDKNPPEEKKPK
ncbi:MAG: twin-arginine translocase TatA/TatE family subunit [Elusimicrobiota bacterium]|nr:twin-arginine translocase TatA/TatE family subunit [Elusimicrobiota bacterium]